MTAGNLMNTCAALGLTAVLAGCAAPAPMPVVDRGRKIDHAVLDGFQRGVTTRAEALAALGEPSSSSTSPEDGSTTCSWDYLHQDARVSIAIMTILKFGPDDKLQIKMVSQSSQSH